MRHALVRLFLGAVFLAASRRKDFRRCLSRMEGRCFALRIRSLDRPFILKIGDGRLKVADGGEPAAEVVSDTWTFLRILGGRLDTDAAFFQRRLRIIGSLEAAMGLKILMDFLIL